MLNKFLDESKRIISSCEKISEAIKNFGEKTENKIKEICYICEINKINEKAIEYFRKPKRYLLFDLDLSNDTVECESYYFHGLPVPSDIDVEENKDKEIVISWKNDEQRINDYNDKYKIKYSIELIRGIHKSTFETSQKKILLEKYVKDTNYKVRIKTIINDSSSE